MQDLAKGPELVRPVAARRVATVAEALRPKAEQPAPLPGPVIQPGQWNDLTGGDRGE